MRKAPHAEAKGEPGRWSRETAGADHLKALARVSRLLHDRAICEKLRGTDGAEAIHALLTESMASHAA